MAASSIPPSAPRDPFESARLQMVEQQLRRRGISDQRVLAAFARVPRHEFLPRDRWTEAYEDKPIQIGAGQTISQPSVHARYLELLHKGRFYPGRDLSNGKYESYWECAEPQALFD